MKTHNTICKILVIGFTLLFATLALAQAKHDWPVEISGPQGKIDIYQPQPEALNGNVLTGRTAVSVTLDNKAPVFGAIWFTAQIQTDLDKRTFELLSVKVTKVKFPQATTSAQEQRLASAIEGSVQKSVFKGSLDSLLATIAAAEKEQKAAENIKTNPPKIVYVNYSAVLVLIDGEPRLQTIEGSKLMRVVNTPMLMVFDPDTKKYYLSSGSVWYSVSDILGAWQIDHNLPSEIARMVTDNGKPVKNNIPDAQMPRIIVSKVPTELIYSDGQAQYTPIPGTNLLFMSNTESDVFMNINNQNYYALISGRWYTTNSLQKGPWSYVAANKLPSDFAKIPANSPKANVLASVANTTQAQEAVAEAEIPQTATIKRDTHFTVKYDGQPQFKKISGTDMQYAVNTSTPVILAQGKYYACDSAVWFVAPTPNGPWNVADSIPSEINSIPPDCPIYNVKYVYVYGSTPEVVYVGYTPGYLGFYPYYGTVVYGTGYVYPVYGPIYYPPPVTFGFAVHYNSYTNTWAFGFRVSYGFATIGFGWNTYWGHGWYPGPYIHHPVYVNNININRNIIIGNNINIGNKNINVNPQFNKNNIYNIHDNANRLVAQGTQRTKPAQVDRNQLNNVITDKDGNIYRNTKNGWQKNVDGKWANANPTPAATTKAATAKQKVSTRPAKTTAPTAPTGQHKQQVAQKSKHVVPNQVVNDYQARERGNTRASSINPTREIRTPSVGRTPTGSHVGSFKR